MADRETILLTGRVTRIQQLLGRSLQLDWPSFDPLPETDRAYLQETGEEFYWNDLEWEKLTGEEQVGEEFLTEQAFPGFLAFVRGLLLAETQPDSTVPPRPSPEIVEGLLHFLLGRVVELEEEAGCCGGDDKEHREAELKMTSRLVDLLLYRLYQLGAEDVTRVEAALVTD